MRLIPALLIAPVLAAAALAAAPRPVAASCMMPPPLEQAIQEGESVFVGTVIGLRQDGRWATVQVQEIWRGPDLPETVEVRGGPEAGMATSIDRHYAGGSRYLFVVSVVADAGGRYLSDNSCTSTSEWRDAMAPLRPVAVRQPLPAGPGDGDAGAADLAPLVLGAMLALVVGVTLFGAAAVLRRG
jgi:hypothetical protein